MGACFDRLRYEVFQNLFLSSMNTGFVRLAVATVLTVYGIETEEYSFFPENVSPVATVLTVYGIETHTSGFNPEEPVCWLLQQYLPFTVLKLSAFKIISVRHRLLVATVLTVYGIETIYTSFTFNNLSLQLQQYLPFTVLKHIACR